MKLTVEAVEFAKKHISKYCDSDFYPRSNTFEYLWKVWDEVKRYLINTEISEFETTIPKVFAAPKSKGGFRIVHQLDPLNAIIYTALAFLIAEKVEQARMPKESKIACSYRIAISDNGDFFENGKFYDDFLTKSEELAQQYEYVLKTDITDFYNQIYIHRLQNAIETADKSLYELSLDIERFILNLNSNASKGIPVGPAASIVFSEALMIDVDNFISNCGFEFTRYVDDFRIFAHTKKDLDKILEEFTKYLYEQHRLNLSSSKTEIFSTSKFITNDLKSPENQEKQKQHEQLVEIAKKLVAEEGYSSAFIDQIEMSHLTQSEQNQLNQNVLYQLLEKMVLDQSFDLGLIRHILKQARIKRIRSILLLVLENFDYFLPAIREVCLYLDSVLSENAIKNNEESFIKIFRDSESMNLSFVKYWMDWLLTKKIKYINKTLFREYLNNQEIAWKIKQNISQMNIPYINSLKINYDEYNIWTRFEILKGIQLLPTKEKNAFLASRNRGLNKTEMFMIKAVRM